MEISQMVVRLPVHNAIESAIALRVGEARDLRLEEQYRERICSELGITSKHFTQILNNNSWVSVKQLAVIAQLLGMPMESLLTY